jgi:hypothetical protein
MNVKDGSGEVLERAKGLEPSTPTLARSCSTTELHPHPKALAAMKHRQRESYAKCAPRMQQGVSGQLTPESPDIAVNAGKRWSGMAAIR